MPQFLCLCSKVARSDEEPHEAKAMMILAESFDALYVGAGSAVLLVMAMVSFIPSSRGHLAGPIIAAPSVLSLLFVGVIASHAGVHPAYWVVCLLPVVLGVGSVALWKLKK